MSTQKSKQSEVKDELQESWIAVNTDQPIGQRLRVDIEIHKIFVQSCRSKDAKIRMQPKQEILVCTCKNMRILTVINRLKFVIKPMNKVYTIQYLWECLLFYKEILWMTCKILLSQLQGVIQAWPFFLFIKIVCTSKF